MAFATTAQLCQEFDRRDIAGLCSESDSVIVPAASVESNPIAQAAMEKGAALIVSAAAVANKYTEAELESLAASGDQFIIQLNCNLSMGLLLKRRSVQRPAEEPQAVKEANQWLAALRLGEMIFNLPNARDAGNVKTVAADVVELRNAGLISGVAAGRFFPMPPTWE